MPRPLLPVVIASAACALRAGAASADPPPDLEEALPTYRRPDTATHTGLMLRVAVGFGYLAVRGDDTPLENSGGAFTYHAAAGWFVVPNLAVHVSIWSAFAFNPTGTSVNGVATISHGSTPLASGRGLGATWVFADVEAFVSASVGVGSLDLETESSDIAVVATTDPGVAVHVLAGKQFSVSSGWRFGVGATGFFQRNGVTSRGVHDDLTTFGGGLVGTLAYH